MAEVHFDVDIQFSLDKYFKLQKTSKRWTLESVKFFLIQVYITKCTSFILFFSTNLTFKSLFLKLYRYHDLKKNKFGDIREAANKEKIRNKKMARF